MWIGSGSPPTNGGSSERRTDNTVDLRFSPHDDPTDDALEHLDDRKSPANLATSRCSSVKRVESLLESNATTPVVVNSLFDEFRQPHASDASIRNGLLELHQRIVDGDTDCKNELEFFIGIADKVRRKRFNRDICQQIARWFPENLTAIVPGSGKHAFVVPTVVNDAAEKVGIPVTRKMAYDLSPTRGRYLRLMYKKDRYSITPVDETRSELEILGSQAYKLLGVRSESKIIYDNPNGKRFLGLGSKGDSKGRPPTKFIVSRMLRNVAVDTFHELLEEGILELSNNDQSILSYEYGRSLVAMRFWGSTNASRKFQLVKENGHYHLICSDHEFVINPDDAIFAGNVKSTTAKYPFLIGDLNSLYRGYFEGLQLLHSSIESPLAVKRWSGLFSKRLEVEGQNPSKTGFTSKCLTQDTINDALGKTPGGTNCKYWLNGIDNCLSVNNGSDSLTYPLPSFSDLKPLVKENNRNNQFTSRLPLTNRNANRKEEYATTTVI